MVSIDDLRKIKVLDDLTQPMLESMRPLTQLNLFGEGHVVYRKGEPADFFYMLLKGKTMLEMEGSEGLMISLGAVKPGYSFGWSSLFPHSEFGTYARCIEPCEMMSIPGNSFLKLLESDHTIGYTFMNSVARILQRRLDRRTWQLIQVMSNHPDLQKLMAASK